MVTDKAKERLKNLYQIEELEFESTDPEFVEFFENFANDEVINNTPTHILTEPERQMVILSSLVGSSSVDLFPKALTDALNAGLPAVEVRELVYQAVAYLGYGRVYPFIKNMNKVFSERGIDISQKKMSTTTVSNRREKGTEKQVEIFGPQMATFFESGPDDRKHINYWLAANCFGDYYTREGLSNKTREMITFCFLAAQGGCQPQLISHAQGNFSVGNDVETLIEVVSEMIPYIGYPRCLNALSAIDSATN